MEKDSDKNARVAAENPEIKCGETALIVLPFAASRLEWLQRLERVLTSFGFTISDSRKK
jgi:hypothetical protein